MKKILIVLNVLLAVSANAQHDNGAAEAKHIPPKGVSVIYAKHVSFDSVFNRLTERGFSFEQVIKNSFIKAKHGITSISFVCYNIRYSDSTAEIIGTKYVNSTDQRAFFNSFPTKKEFKEMNDFALSLNGDISYEK